MILDVHLKLTMKNLFTLNMSQYYCIHFTGCLNECSANTALIMILIKSTKIIWLIDFDFLCGFYILERQDNRRTFDQTTSIIKLSSLFVLDYLVVFCLIDKTLLKLPLKIYSYVIVKYFFLNKHVCLRTFFVLVNKRSSQEIDTRSLK